MTVASIPVSVRISDHAITRYRERCKPALDDENAGRDLGRIAALGRVLTEAPRWLVGRARQTSPLYLEVGDIILPLVPDRGGSGDWCAVTCIARGGISEPARRRRTDRRRVRAPRAGRRSHRSRKPN